MTRLGVEGAALLAALHEAAMPGQGWSEAAFAALLAQHGTLALATAEGFVLARLAADEAEIIMLAVHPAARRRGLARRLLAAARATLATNGAGALFLEAAAGNAAARRLYAEAGFIEVARRARYYADGDDALVLRLTLSCGS
jgi:ribosomal-protein-alanine N-acetyltransferase